MEFLTHAIAFLVGFVGGVLAYYYWGKRLWSDIQAAEAKAKAAVDDIKK